MKGGDSLTWVFKRIVRPIPPGRVKNWALDIWCRLYEGAQWLQRRFPPRCPVCKDVVPQYGIRSCGKPACDEEAFIRQSTTP